MKLKYKMLGYDWYRANVTDAWEGRLLHIQEFPGLILGWVYDWVRCHEKRLGDHSISEKHTQGNIPGATRKAAEINRAYN
jgi:hypothetical protein